MITNFQIHVFEGHHEFVAFCGNKIKRFHRLTLGADWRQLGKED